MKKVFAIFLILVLLVTPLASCGRDIPESTTDVPPVSTQNIENVASNVPNIPENLDISGDFHILVSGNALRNDFDGSEDSSDIVEQAEYNRNQAIKDKYGVNITNEDIVRFNSSNGQGDGFQKIYTEYMAGTKVYDAAMVGTADVSTLAYNGLLWDLNSLPHIDLTKDYWDQRANEDLAIAGKMFYSTGDISVVDNLVTHAIIFNKDMVKDYQLENPYDLVEADQWTLEKFGALVKQVGQDVDQNGIYDENDMYGLLTWNDPMVSILSASGERIASLNDKGEMELTLYNERVVNLYDRFGDIVYDQQHAYNFQYDNVTGKATPSGDWDKNRDAIFNEGRALFYQHNLGVVARHRDTDLNFGILPYPKLDVAQEEYGHFVSNFHASFFCIPLMSDPTRASAVGELLAYYGQEYLTPAYYDKVLIGRTVRDTESTEMLDLILSTHVYDLGACYSIGKYGSALTQIYQTRQSISTIYETYRESAQAKIDSINQAYFSNGK